MTVTRGGPLGSPEQRASLIKVIDKLWPKSGVVGSPLGKSLVIADQGVSLLFDLRDSSLGGSYPPLALQALKAYVSRWGARDLDVEVYQDFRIKAVYQIRLGNRSTTGGTGTPTIRPFSTTFGTAGFISQPTILTPPLNSTNGTKLAEFDLPPVNQSTSDVKPIIGTPLSDFINATKSDKMDFSSTNQSTSDPKPLISTPPLNSTNSTEPAGSSLPPVDQTTSDPEPANSTTQGNNADVAAGIGAGAGAALGAGLGAGLGTGTGTGAGAGTGAGIGSGLGNGLNNFGNGGNGGGNSNGNGEGGETQEPQQQQEAEQQEEETEEENVSTISRENNITTVSQSPVTTPPPTTTQITTTTSSRTNATAPLCTSCPVCQPYVYPLDLATADNSTDPEGDNDTDEDFSVVNPTKRSLFKSFKPKLETEMGGCAGLEPFQRKPHYPKVRDFLRSEEYRANLQAGNQGARSVYGPTDMSEQQISNLADTAQRWAVVIEPLFFGVECGLADWDMRTSDEIVKLGYSLDGRGQPGGKEVNIDHIWEAQLLPAFFDSRGMRRNQLFGCDQFRQLFNQVEDPNNAMVTLGGVNLKRTRISAIFEQVGSYDHPEFVGMDKHLNNLKGKIFKIGRIHPPFLLPATIKEFLRDYALVFSIVRDDRVRKLWDTTNNRIYEGFQALDKVITDMNCGQKPILDAANKPIVPNWAAGFRNFIDSFIANKNKEWEGHFQDGIRRLRGLQAQGINGAPATQEEVSLVAGYKVWLDSFEAKYPLDQLVLPPARWPQAPVTTKRDDATACPIRTNTTTPAGGDNLNGGLSNFGLNGPANTTIPPAVNVTQSKPDTSPAVNVTNTIPNTPAAVDVTNTKPDPCGPEIQLGTEPNTCDLVPAVTKENELYGISCAKSPMVDSLGGTTINPSECTDAIVDICSAMTGNPSTTSKDVWVTRKKPPTEEKPASCSLSFYVPSLPGSAPIPSHGRCVQIFDAMIKGCEGQAYPGSTINVKRLPFEQPQNDNGEAVNAGYPSYMVANLAASEEPPPTPPAPANDVVAAGPKTDPCGPAVQTGTEPNTCTDPPQLSETHSAYGITCLDSPVIANEVFTWQGCNADGFVSACLTMTGLTSTHGTPGEKPIPKDAWITRGDSGGESSVSGIGCRYSFYLPSMDGVAPPRTYEQCARVYEAMVGGCGEHAGGAVVNLNRLPLQGDTGGDNGMAVNGMYPSYIVSNLPI